MSERQTRNVSFTKHHDEFVDGLVATGRYKTASEVVRDGLRLLEEANHRRLLEKWIYGGLGKEEEDQLPRELKDRAKAYFQGLVDEAMADVKDGRVSCGSEAMQRLRDEFENRSG
ncbi:MAG: type II toxin-antitoxin system ParD family antitoxin [Planctomycetota bacterium]|jgi:putative addiction module CopG family antidote